MAVRIYLEESARRFETFPGTAAGRSSLVRAKRSFFAGWACCGSAWQAARLPLNRPRRRCSAAWAPVLTFPVMQ